MPFRFHLILVIFNFNLIFLSKSVVEVCGDGFKSALGISDQDVLVSLVLRDWHQLEKMFGKCLVHILFFFNVFLINCPLILEHLILDGVVIDVGWIRARS